MHRWVGGGGRGRHVSLHRRSPVPACHIRRRGRIRPRRGQTTTGWFRRIEANRANGRDSRIDGDDIVSMPDLRDDRRPICDDDWVADDASEDDVPSLNLQ